MFYKGEIPFVRLLLPLVAGIFAGDLFADEVVFNTACLLLLFLLLVFAGLISAYKSFSVYRYPWAGGALVFLFIMIQAYQITIRQSQVFEKERYDRADGAEVLLIRVSDEPRISGNTLRFESDVTNSYSADRWNVSTGKLMISLNRSTGGDIDIQYGDLLLIPARYNAVNLPYNPGEFDYRKYLSRRQIYFQAFFQGEEIFRLNENQGNRIIAFALDLRKKMVRKFEHYLPDQDAAAFASTLILGYRAELSRELVEAYSDTGTMHVLSVSGMHVGIIFLVLSFVLRSMNRKQVLRLARAILIVLIIWFYAMITGFSAPASRAAFMLSFVVLGKALLRHQNTYNLVAISAFFLLLYNPFYLFDAGFQLSYLAVLGLVYFQPLFRKILPQGNKLTHELWNYCALSLGAQLTTFPLSIYYFHQFPVYFLLGNLFIALPAAIIMYAGIGFMFIYSETVLYYGGLVLNRVIMETNGVLFAIEDMPFSTWKGIWISGYECFILYLLMVCFILRISFNFRKALLPLSILSLVFCAGRTYNTYQDSERQEIIFYNLRRNTAMAYLSNGKSVVVSDLRSDDKTLDYSVVPALKSRGSARELFFGLQDRFATPSCYGEKNFYQLAGYRIIRWDPEFNYRYFERKLDVDAVLISGGPRILLKDIQRSLNFKKLIIDANNPDFRVTGWLDEAGKTGLNCYVLKNNHALVIRL